MSNRKITDMAALTTPATGDVLPIIDISEAAAADKNKKISIGELFKGIPDGTAAAPSIAFESDDGNGMFLAGTDTVGITTGGTQRVTIDSSGNLGIGTSTQSSVEGAGLQVRKYIDRNATYYAPDGHYAGSFGYTNDTKIKSGLLLIQTMPSQVLLVLVYFSVLFIRTQVVLIAGQLLKTLRLATR